MGNSWGIRPAFYLNEPAMGGMKGSGTPEDPYVLLPNPNYIAVTMNGRPVFFDVVPVIESNRVLVPFRAIFEAFESEVFWDGGTQTVTAGKATESQNSINLKLCTGDKKIQLNNKTVELDVPPKLIKDRTYVPIRAISEGLNAKADWDQANKIVKITTAGVNQN